MYRTVTHQIEVQVAPRFLSEKSSPENGYFFWAYTITLRNLGGETVQLKTRHWRITDADSAGPAAMASPMRLSAVRRPIRFIL